MTSALRSTLVGAAAAITLALSGCSASVSTSTTETTAPPAEFTSPAATSSAGEGYTAEVQEAYLSNCVTAASQAAGLTEEQAQAYCGCTYRAFEANVPFEQFAKIDESGQIPDSFQQYITACNSDPNSF